MKTKILNTILFTLLTVVTFAQTKFPLITGITQKNPTCNRYSDGEITILPSGGFPPYTYQWSNGDTTQTISNLLAGTYSVTVTDSYNSLIGAVVTLTDPLPVTVIGTMTSVTSYGLSNGSIDIVQVNNNTGSYTYEWTTGGGSFQDSTTFDQQGLTAGDYKIIVTDSIGCMGIGYFTINQPNPSLPNLNNPNLITPSISNNTSAISTFPNPSNGNITVDFKSDKGEYKIVSVNSGVMVDSGNVGQEKINVNNLPTGTYVIYFQNGDKTQTERVTVL